MKSVRNLCQCLLCLFVMVTACPKPGQAANNDHFIALQALNHSLIAVEMVLRQPYKATVDAQRLAIVEQLKLPESLLKAKGQNKDKGNASSLQKLLDELTALFSESGNDNTDLARVREAEEAAVMAALAKVPAKTVLVAGSARGSFKPLAKDVMSNGPLGSLLVLAENPADLEIPLAHVINGPGEKLDQAVIERFVSLRKQLLATRDDFVSKTKLPAREVLTEGRLGLFLEIVSKEKQVNEAMSLVRKHEKELSFWPPFWFYYGKIAQAKGDDALARRCFREFERRSRGCLKRNTYHAALSLNRLVMLDREEEEEARRVLEVMNRNLTQVDWPKGLVAGLQYYTLGDRRRAEQQIQRNAKELKILVPVHNRLFGLLKEKSFAISALLADAGKNVKEDQPAPATAEKKEDSLKISLDKPTEKAKEDQPAKELDQAQDKTKADPKVDQAEKPEAKAAETEQKDQQMASQPATDESSSTTEGEKPASIGDSQEPATLPVDNTQDSANDVSAPAKVLEASEQNDQQDKADGQNRNLDKDVQKDPQKDDQSAVNPGNEKPAKALPASGTIGARQEAETDHGKQKAATGEQGSMAKQPKESKEQGSQDASPGIDPEAVQEAVPEDNAASRSGQEDQERDNSESSHDPELDSAANAKDAKALYLLAMSHYRGENGKKDLVRAIMMLTQAAGQGNADAQTQLGFCHYTGNGVAKDKTKAVRYFSQAADQGNTNAMFNLAVCYHNGDGVEKDIAKAAELYTAAALKGETRSQYNLAMLYYRGEGVEKDVARARKLLESLSAQGFVPARKAMEYLDTRQEKAEQPKK